MNLRYTVVLATIGLIVPLPTLALTGSASTTGDVHVRTGPGTGHARIATLSSSADVRVQHCRKHWCRIHTGDIRGWVSAHYLDRGATAHAANPTARADAQPPVHGLLPLPHRPFLAPGPVRSPYFNPKTWPGAEPR